MNATANPERIALEFVECINNQDIEGLVSLMTQDFAMIAHEGDPEIGRELMKKDFEGCFSEYPEYRIHIEKWRFRGTILLLLGKRLILTFLPRLKKKRP